MAAAESSAGAAAPLRVSVKWNSKEYGDLEVDVNESLTLFKAQLFTLTGVPPERQKLMAKGKLLKEMHDLQRAAAAAASKTGGTGTGGQGEPLKLVMMGTAEGAELRQPVQQTVFLEDLTPAEQARLLREKNIEPLPSGITNLGNTCYLASVLQMLRPCHELTAAIRTYITSNASVASLASGSSGASYRLGLAIKDFYAHWENSSQAAQPLLLVHAIREAFPQFARKSAAGPAGLVGEVYMQQDAEECLMCFTSVLGDMLPKSRTAAAIAALPTSYSKAENFVEALFGFDTLLTSWREQPGDDPALNGSRTVEKKLEKRIEFTCFLGTIQQPVNTLDEGLKFSLGEERIDINPEESAADVSGATSTSASAGLGASNNTGSTTLVRSSLFASLPFYLIVHFMRFEWKRSGGQTEKAKVCKSLKFSHTLDVQPFCTDPTKSTHTRQTDVYDIVRLLLLFEDLKEQLRVGRAVLTLRRDREVGEPTASGDTAAKSGTKSACKTDSVSNADSSSGADGVSNDLNNSKDDKTLEGGGPASAQSSLSNGSNTGANEAGQHEKKQGELSKNGVKTQKIYPTGLFNLLGIVTHQGRHADSGHYVGWAKKDQREPRRIEREQREKEELQAAEAARLEAEGKSGEGKSRGYVRPQRRVKHEDIWLKFDDDKVYELPWSQIDLAGGRSDYHIAYLLMFRHCMVEPTKEELQTVERMHQEHIREAQILAEQKKRKAAGEVAAISDIATKKS